VVNQVNFVSQIWTGELSPDEMSMTWTQIAIGALLALVTTFLAPIMLHIALGPEKPTKAMTQTRRDIEDVYETFRDKAADATSTVNTTIITAKDDLARELAELMAKMGKELKAA
jgi:hypothetical protein